MEQIELRKQLRDLEHRARPLEPDAAQREALASQVLAYANTFIENLDHSPAFQTMDDGGAGLYDAPVSPDGLPMEEILALLASQVDNLGTNSASPRHMAYIPGGALYHAALADYLAAVTNRYSGHFYGSPGAVRMENLVLRWMADLVGYPGTAAGNLSSGGSIAHLIAIATAREAAGLKAADYPRAVVYLTDQVHHSFEKALRIAGMGECKRRFLPTDAGHRMRSDMLEDAIREDLAQGRRPWMVVASAGTTNSGAVDPLEPVGLCAHTHGIWFHVDAAYGGFFLLCAPGRARLNGIEAADSIVMDPHKGLFLPFGTGTVLVREARHLYAAFSGHGAYMQDALQAMEELSPADLSPELSRHFRGLRVWLPLQLLGTAPFAAALEEKLLLAEYFYTQLMELPGFEPGPPPDLSIVTFRYRPDHGDPDEFNQLLIRAVNEDGRILLSSTILDGQFVIRLAVLGYHTHLKEIDLALAVLQEKAAWLAAA